MIQDAQLKQNFEAIPSSTKALFWGILFSFAVTGLIYVLDIQPPVPLLPDQGASWYYWKLPEPTFWSRTTAWGLYILHQAAIWGVIFYVQKNRFQFSTSLRSFNYFAIAVNVIFIFLHILQTYIWYDGLAQDVSIFSSLSSVVLLLMIILLMENKRRGLFFGY